MSAMPIGACSNALRNRSCASRSSASARRRSVRSRALMTMPSIGGVVEQVGADRLDDAPAAVGVTQPELDPVGVSAGARRAVEAASSARSRSSGWMRSNTSVPMQRLDVEPEDAFGRRARVDETALGVDDRHDVVGVAHHRLEAGLVALEELA